MPAYFIYSNLKVHPFLLGDKPLDGFELLAWDSWTIGTLWDIGGEAGFSIVGKTRVHGQLWKLVSSTQENLLKECFGFYKGLVRSKNIEVNIPIDTLVTDTLKATTFTLERIDPNYQIIHDGKWRF